MDVNIKINMNYTKNYVVRDYTLHNNAKTTFSLTFFYGLPASLFYLIH